MGAEHPPLPSLTYSFLLHFDLEDVNLSRCKDALRLYTFLLTAVVLVSKIGQHVELLRSHLFERRANE